MNINKEDIDRIRKFQDIMNRGYYASGKEVVELYNKVLEKRANPTNCGACIRRYITELVDALNRFEKMSEKLSEASKPQEETVVKEEENKAIKTKKKGK